MNEDRTIMDIHEGVGLTRTDKETIRLYEETKKLADALGFVLKPLSSGTPKIEIKHKLDQTSSYASTSLESIHAFLVGWKCCRRFLKK